MGEAVKARFEIELSGVYGWERLANETPDESLAAVKRELEEALGRALRYNDDRRLTRLFSVVALSAHDVDYGKADQL